MKTLKCIPLLAFALLTAGCGDPGEQSLDAGQAALDSPTVASVNDEPISRALLDAYLRARGSTNPTPRQREQALQEVVNLVLLRQQAEKQGLDDTLEVQADLALHRTSTLATRQVRNHNAENPVTEADAREEYNRNRETAGTKEYHVRHILLPSREAAEQAIAELNQGADFAKLANERSQDTRQDAGGGLGWLDLTQLPEALREAIRGMRTAAHSQEPVQTRFGWHVLKLVDTRKLEPPEFDQVRQGVVASLQRQRMESYVQELRAGADIKVTEAFTESPSATPDPTAAPAARPEGGAEPAAEDDPSGN